MEKFDVIVVGAGPAGSTAACVLAREGLKVLLLERAKTPGGKNVFGGRIYSHVLKRLFPGFEKSAPVERFVVRETIGMMDENDCTSVDFSSGRGELEGASSFVAIRARFDRWLSEQAEQAGALLVSGTKVDDLLIHDGHVGGIMSGGDAIGADCVVDAEGVTATLSRRAGLRVDVLPGQVKVGVKETIRLGKDAVGQRFNLGEKEGAACVFIGYPSSYLPAGGAFVYTNEESVSIGIVVDAEEVSRAKLEVQALIENFRMHPYMRKLLAGGQMLEYSAHMIPDSVPARPENLVGDGFLVTGDAAGLFINYGFTYRGVDLAMASGEAAALTLVEAHGGGSYARDALMGYHARLSRELLPELHRAEGNAGVLHNERIFSTYPRLAADLMEDLFRIEGIGRDRLSSILKRNMEGRISTLRSLRDLLSAYRKM